MFKLKVAQGPLLWYMKLFGIYGLASPWNTAYVRPSYEYSVRLRRHEFAHLAQMQRDGKLVFLCKYIWWTIRYGYQDNPYEVAARAAEKL